MLASTLILRHDGGHRVGDVLLDHHRVVIRPVHGRERRGGGNAHRIHDGLYTELSDLHRALLQGADKAVGEREPEKTEIKDQPLPPKLQHRDLFLYIDPAQNPGEPLRDHGGNRRTQDAHAQHTDKEQVPEDVKRRTDCKKIQGRLRIPHGAQGPCKVVVDEVEDEAEADHPQVDGCLPDDDLLHLQDPEDLRRKDHHKDRHQD